MLCLSSALSALLLTLWLCCPTDLLLHLYGWCEHKYNTGVRLFEVSHPLSAWAVWWEHCTQQKGTNPPEPNQPALLASSWLKTQSTSENRAEGNVKMQGFLVRLRWAIELGSRLGPAPPSQPLSSVPNGPPGYSLESREIQKTETKTQSDYSVRKQNLATTYYLWNICEMSILLTVPLECSYYWSFGSSPSPLFSLLAQNICIRLHVAFPSRTLESYAPLFCNLTLPSCSIESPLLLQMAQCFVVRLYHTLSSHLSAENHVGWHHVFTMINIATVNITHLRFILFFIFNRTVQPEVITEFGSVVQRDIADRFVWLS